MSYYIIVTRFGRLTIIIPVPKPGQDHTNPSNYRPISLKSCICKTMQYMITERLVWYLESNNLITSFKAVSDAREAQLIMYYALKRLFEKLS